MSSPCPIIPVLAVCVLLASFAAVPGTHAQATRMGWTSATRTTVDSGDGRPAEVSAMREVWAGGRARMETYMGGDSVAPMTIVLMDSAAKTMTSIMAPQQLAMVMGFPPPAGFRVMDYRTMSAGIDQKKLSEAFAPGLEKSLCGDGSH
jgi:hypothetical protein